MNFENDWEEPIAETNSPAPNTNPDEVKMSIYKETKDENNKTEFEIRLKSIQDWFIRCSWIDKYTFLAALCELTQDFYVLERVLLSMENIQSKDVTSSFSKARTNFIYDRIPQDDNRTLSNNELQEAMREDTLWFFNLGASCQIRVIFTLLRLGGCGLMYFIYKHLNETYQGRKTAQALLSAVQELKVEKRMEENENVKKRDTYAEKKLEVLEKRKLELNDFKKKYDIGMVEEIKSQKKLEAKEVVEWIQILPLEINRQIFSHIDDKEAANLKKVGKYWGKMIDETMKEKANRKVIDGKISKITDTMSVKNVNREEDANITPTEPETLGKSALINRKKINEYEIKYAIEKNKHIASRKWELKIFSTSAVPNRTCALNYHHRILASSAIGGTIEFYSIRTGSKIDAEVSEILSPITAVALHEDGQNVVIGCEDGSLICKHTWKNVTTAVYRGHTKAIISLFLTNENVLSTSKDNALKYFHIWSGLCLLCVNLNVGISISVAMPVVDKTLCELIGTEDGRLLIVDLKSKQIKKDLLVHDGNLTGLAQDKDLVITAGTDGKIRIWDLLRSEKGMEPKLYHDINVKFPVKGIKFLNTQIFAICNDGNLRIICEITGTVFKTIRISTKSIIGLELFHDPYNIKVITWTEDQLEMRTVSLEKFRMKSKKLKTSTGIESKLPLMTTRLSLPWRRKSHMEPKDSLTDMTVKSKAFKYIPPNRKEEISEEKFCSVSELRHFSTPIQKFKKGVFAEMASRNSQNIIFRPFSRLKKV